MPIPWAVDLARFCRQFQVLPRAGGVLDQEPFELYALRQIEQIEAAYKMSLTELVEAELLQARESAIETATQIRNIIWPK